MHRPCRSYLRGWPEVGPPGSSRTSRRASLPHRDLCTSGRCPCPPDSGAHVIEHHAIEATPAIAEVQYPTSCPEPGVVLASRAPQLGADRCASANASGPRDPTNCSWMASPGKGGAVMPSTVRPEQKRDPVHARRSPAVSLASASQGSTWPPWSTMVRAALQVWMLTHTRIGKSSYGTPPRQRLWLSAER